MSSDNSIIIHSNDDVLDINNMDILGYGDDIDILGNVNDENFIDDDNALHQQIVVGDNNVVNETPLQRQIAIGVHDWPYSLDLGSESQIEDLSDLQTSVPHFQMPPPPPLEHNLHYMQSSMVN